MVVPPYRPASDDYSPLRNLLCLGRHGLQVSFGTAAAKKAVDRSLIDETMIILGLNAYHADSAACLIVDGKLVAAAEEERFRRIKHWAGLPTEAIDYCLREARLTWRDVKHIAINRKPGVNNWRRLL